MKKILIFVFLSFYIFSFAQEAGVKQWKDYLPYNNGIFVAKRYEIVYCASNKALFTYNEETKEVTRISTVNGLSDINISALAFDKITGNIIIGYENGNIDFIEKDNNFLNISDLKNGNIIGDKRINNITISNDGYAYLSCGFGIVKLNIEKKELSETYFIGNNSSNVNVNDIELLNNYIYAATDNGIYRANLNTNLSDFNNWQLMSQFNQGKYNTMAVFNNKLFVNKRYNQYNSDTIFIFDGTNKSVFNEQLNLGTWNIVNNGDTLILVHNESIDAFNLNMDNIEHIYQYQNNVPLPRYAIYDSKGIMWVADYEYGLVKVLNNWNAETISISGPPFYEAYQMTYNNGRLLVARGGLLVNWLNLWMNRGIYYMEDNNWVSLYKSINALDTIFDIIQVETAPNDDNTIYAASWHNGLLEIKNNILTNIYDDKNSSLQNISQINFRSIRISGIAFDNNNNLWVSNALTDRPLSVRTNNGKWYSFALNGQVGNLTITGKVIVDSYNQKWLLLPKDNKIVVFDENGTFADESDDNIRVLTNAEGNGNLPGGLILDIANDKNGVIWVCTDKGIIVYYNPEEIFLKNEFNGEQILIDQGGYIQPLLESEIVTSIAIDPANRKWFGTDGSGVFFISEDGTKELAHFTKENSPLLSNKIQDIAINENNGEVFIATNEGIISYRSDATLPMQSLDNVYAYPNPVYPDYEGFIVIKNLMQNTTVKISDLYGNLVFETVSVGGQALWNGKNLKNKKVNSGIYLVYATDEQGNNKVVTKILIFH